MIRKSGGTFAGGKVVSKHAVRFAGTVSRGKPNHELLPTEIMHKIFNFLDVKSLLTCATICRRWEMIANDNLVWKKNYMHYSNEKQPRSPLAVPDRYWKCRFMQHAKNKRNNKFNKSMKSGIYSSAASDIPRLGNKFQVSLTTVNGTVHNYVERTRVCKPFAITLHWYSLKGFPTLKNVCKIEIFSLSPILIGHSGKMLVNGPRQRCLVLSDTRIYDSLYYQVCDFDEVCCHCLGSGVMIGLWKKTDDIAFITTSLHTYQLINKCLLSTSDTIFNEPHVAKLDDVSRLYGLQGYEFRFHVVTGFEDIFMCNISSDAMDMTKNASLISYRSKSSLHMPSLNDINLKWRTDVFKGELKNMALLTFTAIDFNQDIICHVSRPVKCEITKNSQASMQSSNLSAVTLLCVDESVGSSLMLFRKHDSHDRFSNDDEGYFLDELEVTFFTKFINSWFGTNY